MPNRLRALAGCVLAASLIAAAPAAAAPGAAAHAAFRPTPAATKNVTAHAARGCSNTRARPTRRNLRAVRRAVLCLVNAERRRAGLRPLRANRRLHNAATRHSRDMVAHRYFSHVTPSGRTGGTRISAAHYRWMAWGENIGWGQAHLATPARIVRSWMKSPGHRANILNGSFRHSGLGVALGTPVGGGGATYTHDFGRP